MAKAELANNTASNNLDKEKVEKVVVKGETNHGFIRVTAGPLFLMSVTPFFVFFCWISVRKYDGAVFPLVYDLLFNFSKVKGFMPAQDPAGYAIVLTWLAVQFVLLVTLPGEKFLGPLSETGFRPQYKLNGVLNYFVSFALYLGAAYGLKLFNGGLLYDKLGEIMVALSTIAPLVCVFLFFKGKYFPSSADNYSTGYSILDFYWGSELYPAIGTVSWKQLINCRFAMMGWNILLLSYLLKQYELYGFVSNSMIASFVIQTVYIFKFFVWENGYFISIDIMHDRFGYYICWGCMVWLPMTYTLCGFYLTEHPTQYSLAYISFVIGLGVFAVWANYDADNQRLKFRQNNGKVKIWGKDAEYVTAKYYTADGKEHESKLLVTGWWGVARHFNYIWELMLAFAWTLPVGFSHMMPWFYFVYLCILLSDRAVRDDDRCTRKYGKDFQKYCDRVRYRMIPGIF